MKYDDEKNANSAITPDPAAVKATEPSQDKRELTDDEIAAVAGGKGVVKVLNPQPLPPISG